MGGWISCSARVWPASCLAARCGKRGACIRKLAASGRWLRCAVVSVGSIRLPSHTHTHTHTRRPLSDIVHDLVTRIAADTGCYLPIEKGELLVCVCVCVGGVVGRGGGDQAWQWPVRRHLALRAAASWLFDGKMCHRLSFGDCRKLALTNAPPPLSRSPSSRPLLPRSSFCKQANVWRCWSTTWAAPPPWK